MGAKKWRVRCGLDSYDAKVLVACCYEHSKISVPLKVEKFHDQQSGPKLLRKDCVSRSYWHFKQHKDCSRPLDNTWDSHAGSSLLESS
jgi:hypothetical protein